MTNTNSMESDSCDESHTGIITNVEDMPGFLVRRCWQVSREIFARHMAGIQVTVEQFFVLTVLGSSPDCTQVELAKRIHLDQATTGSVVKRLADRGMIDRRRSPKDNRGWYLSLTPQGRDFLDRIRQQSTPAKNELISPLTSDEYSTLMTLMRKLTER